MPLSPLFTLERPRKEFLADAGVNPEDTMFQGCVAVPLSNLAPKRP